MAPTLTAAGLSTLREQVAAAPTVVAGAGCPSSGRPARAVRWRTCQVRRRRWISLLFVVAGVVAALAGLGSGGGEHGEPAATPCRSWSPGTRSLPGAVVRARRPGHGRSAAIDRGARRGHRPGRRRRPRAPPLPLPAGTPLMAPRSPSLGRPGDRDVAIRLDTAAGIPAGALSGARADLYATAARHAGGRGRSFATSWSCQASAGDGEAVATLRVPDARWCRAGRGRGPVARCGWSCAHRRADDGSRHHPLPS